jgi:hypothetical protein
MKDFFVDCTSQMDVRDDGLLILVAQCTFQFLPKPF